MEEMTWGELSGRFINRYAFIKNEFDLKILNQIKRHIMQK